MFIPGNFRIRGMGNSNRQPDKQGWISLGEERVGNSGSAYVAPVLPLLSFWKTDRDGKPTVLGAQLAKLDANALSDVRIAGIDYLYSSTQAEDKKRWFENHNLVAIDKLTFAGQDVADDDAVLPQTNVENEQVA